MTLLGGYIFPHPPIIIPEIGKGEESKAQSTIGGVNRLSQEIAQKKPKTIVLITPHGPVFQDAVCISAESKLYGDFGKFGHGELKFEFDNNNDLVDRIEGCAGAHGIVVGKVDKSFAENYKISTDIDHGALVPLYFVNKYYKDYKLVHITMGLLPYEDLYKFGICISDIIKESGEEVIVISSSDLSHRLTPEAPAGFHPRGKEFDEQLISLLKRHGVEELLEMDEDLIECAGECGFRPIVILQGIMDSYDVEPGVLSYEGPYGVGYAAVKYAIEGPKEVGIYENLLLNRAKKMEQLRRGEDEYVTIARTALEKYIKDGEIINPPETTEKELLTSKAGVFVSIKRRGQLRGCIGTISPTRKNVAEEIIHNAISSGTRDPRFSPVDDYEVEDLVYSVDVLKEPETIKSRDELDVQKYGVIVKKGNRSGLLLPNLEGVDTIDYQISIALSKAGIREDENFEMERFEVVRHGTK